MLIPTYQETVQIDRIKKFDNELFFYSDNQAKPFAYRSFNTAETAILPDMPTAPSSVIGAFSLYSDGDKLYCTYDGAQRITSYISKVNDRTINAIQKYLHKAYSLDPYAISLRAAFDGFEELVCTVSGFCGCLTDVVGDRSDANYYPIYGSSLKSLSCEQIAISLPIIALMFRHFSALRGFNFKVTFKDSLPCLIFSARALLGDIKEPADIPEYSVLADTLGDNGLVIASRIKRLDEYTESGEPIYRLSLAVCPQSFDPRGILRAPAWRQHVKDLIDDLDIELTGKY